MRLLKIGSSSECDIVLNSRKVSYLHAELILLNNGDILLEDKGSTNGTFVNNQLVKQGASVAVRRGDLIRFGDTELQWSAVPQQANNAMFKKIYGVGSNMRYNDIQVTGNTVSRFHATLKIDKKGRAFIEDHSLNGTTINGKRIASHQNVRVKRGDDVVVGGVPVDLKPYIKPEVGGIVIKTFSAIAAVVAIVLVLLPKPPIDDTNTNPSVDELMNATVMVYGEYMITVTIKDNPYADIGLPSTFAFGYANGGWSLESTRSYGYCGTAFFISEYGELGTNRHIAVPWEYGLTSAHRIDILTQIRVVIEDAVKKKEKEIEQAMKENKETLDFYREKYGIDPKVFFSEEYAKNALLENSNIEISGVHTYLGVLRCGQNYSWYSFERDFTPCQVIVESGSKDIDVAMLRLNDPVTPNGIKHYLMQTARLDETQLKIGEQLHAWGYPGGMDVAEILSNKTQINPFFSEMKVSKIPFDNQFEVQGTALHGSSGSPVFDEDRNLVGVLWGGLAGTETINWICNIKYLVELYEANNYGKYHR